MTRGTLGVLVAGVVAVASCERPAPQRPPEPQAVEARELGSWSGTGSTTLGFVSETGSFRINWTARNKDNASPGSFALTLRSGISGRPLQVIADHRGAGGGSVEFGDDPRMYEFLVDAIAIDWSVSVTETLTSRR